ncbi:HAMP domain-containing sensor histidine kinase [Fusobacterium ulcerans]|uniref:HAMP domain-containing sensor histidine kinase n=1 Tax=Fusobacterium ulcerans TaxID=861 RepID=UPI0026DADF6C|nr:HAMP domain-containing sensor histidine kinase [Fusobacterium ulcerans]
MKIKNKLILTLSLILMILLAAEVILGEFYFEKYFRYSKMKELENINFIVNNKINYDLLKKYQEDNKGFALIIKDNEILTLNNFFHLTSIDEKTGDKKVFLLDELLDNLYSEEKFDIKEEDSLAITSIQILGNYYIPLTIKKGKENFIDYKNIHRNLNVENFQGVVKEVGIPNTIFSQADDFLEFLIAKNINEVITDDYIDDDGDDEFRIINKMIEDYRVIIFYSYEDMKDIFPTIKSYFYFKGIIMIIIVIIIGRILGKNIVDPIEKLSLMAKNIGKLNFEKKGYRKSKDEIEELYKEIYRMSDNLEGIINLYKKELEENKNIKKNIEEKVRYFTHEIKTPLSAIIGFSELLYERDKSEEIEIINTEGKRLLKLTNELIKNDNFNNENYMKFETFNLSQTLQMILKIYEKELKNFIVHINYHENIRVIGNKNKIEQVIFNFLTNSIQHAEKEITISVEEFKKEVKINIENDGKKIKKENLNKIWKKYFTTKKNGTGLGLYVCKEILDAHSSKYNIENTSAGVRATFTLKKYTNET